MSVEIHEGPGGGGGREGGVEGGGGELVHRGQRVQGSLRAAVRKGGTPTRVSARRRGHQQAQLHQGHQEGRHGGHSH